MARRFYNAFDTDLWPPGEHRRQPGEGDGRSPFEIDRDRIIFSTAFRRLQSKTQVFQAGQFDFYRTRLTHSIEVAKICRSIVAHLNATSPHLRPMEGFAIDADLVEAIGLAHDLGHPPFGHIGERCMNALLADAGGFEGNAQTLRILDRYFYFASREPRGMEPTRALLDGVMKYKGLHRECHDPSTGQPPHHHFLYDDQAPLREWVCQGLDAATTTQTVSLECRIMDWADDTAYSLMDIVDGVHARFLSVERIRQWREMHSDAIDADEAQWLEELLEAIPERRFEAKMSGKVGDFIRACQLIERDGPLAPQTHRHRFDLQIGEPARRESHLYKRLAVDLIFRSPPIQRIEHKGRHILQQLWRAHEPIATGETAALAILDQPWADMVAAEGSIHGRRRVMADYIASLTDGEAVRLYQRLYSPDAAALNDLL